MLKKIWMHFVKLWLRIALHIFFKDLRFYGKKNIPRNKAIIFIPNHQNTFLDALLVVISMRGFSHQMARGDIFKNKLVKSVCASINLRPIYKSDTEGYVEKNEEVFNELYYYLSQRESVTLYPEGTHSLRHYTRPLKKGFARIAFGALEKYPQLEDIYVVPVGISYSDPLNFRSSASIRCGEPIAVRPFFESENKARGINKLVRKSQVELTQLMLNLPKENYLHYHRKLKALNADFSDMEQTEKMTEQLVEGKEPAPLKPKNRVTWLEKLLFPLVFVNNIIPILIWKKLKPVFKDVAFYGAIKFAIGFFLVPWIYILQTLLVKWLAGWPWAFVYFFLTVITVPVLRIRRDTIPDKALT